MDSGQAISLCVKVKYIYMLTCICVICELIHSTARIVTCDRLLDPRNGDVDVSGIKIGSKAKYSCDRGFELKGTQVRKCQSNGEWSGREPSCKSKYEVLHCMSLYPVCSYYLVHRNCYM